MFIEAWAPYHAVYGGSSRIFYELDRERLCREKFRDIKCYALLNNWEATYFNFDEEKILSIAEKQRISAWICLFSMTAGSASKIGITASR